MIPPSESHADRRRVKFNSSFFLCFSYSFDISSRDCYFLFEWSSEFSSTRKYEAEAESSAVDRVSLPHTHKMSRYLILLCSVAFRCKRRLGPDVGFKR